MKAQRSDKGRRRGPYRTRKRSLKEARPALPIGLPEAEPEAYRLLHAIILGPDEQLDASIDAARQLLARPITP